MTAIAIVVGVLAYPVIAGRVWRQLDPPERCDGSAWAVGFEPDHTGGAGLTCARSTSSACRQCKARARAKVVAWLWPVTWIPYVGRRLFDAGANVHATPAPPTPSKTNPAEPHALADGRTHG